MGGCGGHLWQRAEAGRVKELLKRGFCVEWSGVEGGGFLLLCVYMLRSGCHVHIRSRVYTIPELPWEKGRVVPKSRISIVICSDIYGLLFQGKVSPKVSAENISPRGNLFHGIDYSQSHFMGKK